MSLLVDYGFQARSILFDYHRRVLQRAQVNWRMSYASRFNITQFLSTDWLVGFWVIYLLMELFYD